MNSSTVILYCTLFVIGALSLHVFRRKPSFATMLGVICIGGTGILLGAALLARDLFDAVRLVSHGLFGVAPLMMIAGAIIAWQPNRKLAIFSGCCAALLLGIALEAFLIGPRRLGVARFELVTPKVKEPVTIVVLADIQTDVIGPHERRALELARAESPDLILYAGDYIQESDPARAAELRSELHDLLLETDAQPRFGAFAVPGNCDPPRWTRIFAGTKVHCFVMSGSVILTNGIRITGLSVGQSERLTASIGGHDGFHIVLGHHPDFVLAKTEGDLCIAGHTHGGQVQLPFIGPLTVLSRIPRNWGAGGLHEIGPDRHLLISRGIGMERGTAPRLRFLCSPQVVVLKLVPAPD